MRPARATRMPTSRLLNDVETLTSNLGRKIWQKITILSQLKDVEADLPSAVAGLMRRPSHPITPK